MKAEHDEIDWLQLDAYFDGTLLPEERHVIDTWTAGHVDRQGLITKYRVLWEAKQRPAHLASEVQTAREEVFATIRGLDSNVKAAPPRLTQVVRRPVPFRLERWQVALASVSLFIVIAIGTLFLRSTSRAETSLRYATAPGQRSTVHLVDGSTMMLAPATSVIVSPDQIDVTGEVYFTIAPRASRPITVRTHSAVVQVLGTVFGVRQYVNEQKARVVVEDGRVSVRDRHGDRSSSRVLSSRMLALVSDSGVTVTSGIAIREYIGWTRGTLVFDRVPLRDVAVELSRAYGTNIHVADSVLADKLIIADVAIEERPLSQVLDAICFIMHAHYARDGNAFVLSPGRGERVVPEQVQRSRFPQPEKQYGR